MSKSAFDQISELLENLSKDELEQIRKKCMVLGSIGPKQRTSISEMHQDWLLSGVLYELEKRGLGNTIPSNFSIRSKQSFSSYQERAERVRNLFEEKAGIKGSVDKLAFGRVLARLLAKKIDQFAPVSLDTLLRNVGLMPEAFEDAFPGYITAGMLPFMVKAMHNEGTGAIDPE